MRRGWRGLRAGPRAALLRSLRLGSEVDRGQLKNLELGRALRPRYDEPPLERRDPLKHPSHVALRIVAIGKRLVLIAEREAAEENEASRIVVFPKAPRRALAAGLLDDGQLIALDLPLAEEWLEALKGLGLRTALPSVIM